MRACEWDVKNRHNTFFLQVDNAQMCGDLDISDKVLIPSGYSSISPDGNFTIAPYDVKESEDGLFLAYILLIHDNIGAVRGCHLYNASLPTTRLVMAFNDDASRLAILKRDSIDSCEGWCVEIWDVDNWILLDTVWIMSGRYQCDDTSCFEPINDEGYSGIDYINHPQFLTTSNTLQFEIYVSRLVNGIARTVQGGSGTILLEAPIHHNCKSLEQLFLLMLMMAQSM